MSPISCDVLIIGGGIAGLSLAAELAGRVRVVLAEAEPTLGYHTSSRSARQLVPSYGPPAIQQLTVRTLDLLHRLESEAGMHIVVSPHRMHAFARIAGGAPRSRT